MNRRRAKEMIMKAISITAAVSASLLLILIISNIAINALPSLSWNFITTAESAQPGVGGAIANAIAGTILLSVFSSLIATPIAIGTAIYLQKYASDSWLTRGFRFVIEVLAGTPSIVLGIFGLLVMVYYLRYVTGGFSLITGTIALSILIIPVIERAIEDAIQRVPKSLEEGSYALGANKWQTIRNITIPSALSGLLTGIILGFGRAAEESAVVILTAGYSQFLPEVAVKQNPRLIFGMKIYPFQDVIGSLPYTVYHAYENANVVELSDGYAAAFVLICIVLIINLTAKAIFYFGARQVNKPSPLIVSLNRAIFGRSSRLWKSQKPAARSGMNNDAPAAHTNPPYDSGNRHDDDPTSAKGQDTPQSSKISDDATISSMSIDCLPALTQPIQPATPVTSIESVGNTHPLSSSKTTSDMSRDGRVFPDDSQDQLPVVDPLAGLVTAYPTSRTLEPPVEDLFEEEPIVLTDTHGTDPGAMEKLWYKPGKDEVRPHEILTEDLSVTEELLMEEEPGHDEDLPPVPFIENWQSMARNKQENSHV